MWRPITSEKAPISFDLYRTGVDMHGPDPITREDLEPYLDLDNPVMTGLELSNENGWRLTVPSLEKFDQNGGEYA